MTKFRKHETAIVESSQIGEGTMIWHHAHVREGVKLGANCVIGKNIYLDIATSIGDNVKIQNNTSVYSGVTIADNVFIGPNVVFTNDLRPRAFLWNETRKGYTMVKQGASIGASSVIICGSKESPRIIGEYAMIGAGSVVTKDVPAHGLVYGNPAKLVGFVCVCGIKISEKEVSQCKGNKCLHGLLE